MGAVAISFLLGGWLVARYVENAHHDYSNELTRKQALVFLDGVGREVRGLSSNVDNEKLSGVLDRAIENSSEDYDFSVFQLRLVGSSGATVFSGSPSRVDASVKSHHSMLRPSQQSEQVVSQRPKTTNKTHSSGWNIQRGVDPDNGEEIAITDLAIPITLNDAEYSLILELDLTSTLRKIEERDRVFDRDIALIVIIVVAIVFITLWWVLARGLTTPISEFSVLADKIARGDLSHRVPSQYPAELGKLSTSINEMADGIDRLLKEEEAAYMQALRSLTKALESKDPYTAKHSARVARFSVLLGRHLSLPVQKLRLLKKGALMHDLGKIGVPDSILNKPEALDDDEYRAMKSHPVNTAQIMAPLKRFKEFTEIAAWHHERWDGCGYPDGLAGEEIPLLARIVAIADSWDAMTGDRIYRKGMPANDALEIMEEQRNSGQWDPVLVDAFVEMMNSKKPTKPIPEYTLAVA